MGTPQDWPAALSRLEAVLDRGPLRGGGPAYDDLIDEALEMMEDTKRLVETSDEGVRKRFAK